MNRLVINAQTKETLVENYELSEEELLKRQKYNEFLEKQNKENQIQELKRQLRKYKEDVEQVELFSMKREDYEEKKSRCVEIIERLRELEKELNGGEE